MSSVSGGLYRGEFLRAAGVAGAIGISGGLLGAQAASVYTTALLISV